MPVHRRMEMLIQLRNINKDYMVGKDSVHILKDINLDIESGEYIAIMGPSGSGKTTLMNLMGCLDVPTSGTYYLDGEDIGAASDNRLTEIRNSYIGFVFQSFYLLPKLTAQENVALPLLYSGMKKKERMERAAKVLSDLGLDDRLDFYPNQLSGGQQQRVAIARAMSTNPKVLFADEPTGALDSASGEQIMELFSKLHDQGVTIIMITHEQFIADHADKIYYIRDGILSNEKGGNVVE